MWSVQSFLGLDRGKITCSQARSGASKLWTLTMTIGSIHRSVCNFCDRGSRTNSLVSERPVQLKTAWRNEPTGGFNLLSRQRDYRGLCLPRLPPWKPGFIFWLPPLASFDGFKSRILADFRADFADFFFAGIFVTFLLLFVCLRPRVQDWTALEALFLPRTHVQLSPITNHAICVLRAGTREFDCVESAYLLGKQTSWKRVEKFPTRSAEFVR